MATIANDAARSRPRSLLAGVQRIDLRHTWQVIAGSILVPLGVLVILLAWYGSAHTPYVQQQIPYLVSGSFVGLGLMIVGALLYWAHWLYRLYDQADLHHEAAMRRQEQLIERLIDAVGTAAPARAARPGAPTVAEGDGLVVTASGANVHRSDCPIILRHPVGVRRLGADEAAGRPACRICQPLG